MVHWCPLQKDRDKSLTLGLRSHPLHWTLNMLITTPHTPSPLEYNSPYIFQAPHFSLPLSSPPVCLSIRCKYHSVLQEGSVFMSCFNLSFNLLCLSLVFASSDQMFDLISSRCLRAASLCISTEGNKRYRLENWNQTKEVWWELSFTQLEALFSSDTIGTATTSGAIKIIAPLLLSIPHQSVSVWLH